MGKDVPAAQPTCNHLATSPAGRSPPGMRHAGAMPDMRAMPPEDRREISDAEDTARYAAHRERPAAKAVSMLMGPTASVAIATLVMCWSVAGLRWLTVGYAVWVAMWLVGLPLLWLWVLIWTGRVADRHLLLRSRRMPVMIGVFVIVLVGVATTAILGFPAALIWLVVTMLVSVLVLSGLTAWWKVSFHTSAVACSLVTIATVWPWAWWLIAPIVAVVAWARVTAGRHSVAQVLAGAVVGGVTTFLMWQLFDRLGAGSPSI